MNYLMKFITMNCQKTTDDFESRAKLYHILMDLEEFLIFNRRFVEGLDERQRRIYWEE